MVLETASGGTQEIPVTDTDVRKKKKEFINSMHLTYNSFIQKEVDIIGLIANKTELDEIEYIENELRNSIPKNVYVDVVPKVDLLAYPTVKEVVKELNGKILFGKQFLDNTIFQPLVLGKAVNLHPLVVVIGVTGGSIVGGFWGMLLAIPTIVVFKVVISTLYQQAKEYYIIY